MKKEAIADLLQHKHNDLITWLEQQDNDKWETGPQGKWTTGQQALHLLQSYKPLNTALSLPKWLLNFRFGKANRQVRDYDKVVNRYLERLDKAKGKEYGPSKNMKIPKLNEKQYLINRLQIEQKKLEAKTRRLSDNILDNNILPHPLMGKMPIREILMWSAYHTEHHANTLKKDY